MSILSHHDEFENYYPYSTKNNQGSNQGKTNAEIFKQTFGIYATELWSMKETDFLNWLNEEVNK